MSVQPAELERRWAKPIKVFEWYDDPNSFLHEPVRGGLMRGVNYTTDQEGWDRIRTGYVCVACTEPQEQPYPEKCSVCGFPMKEAQDKEAQRRFGGGRWVGKRTSWADELERLDTVTGPRMRYAKGSQILVPRGAEV